MSKTKHFIQNFNKIEEIPEKFSCHIRCKIFIYQHSVERTNKSSQESL